jgi:hypothetical protein
MRRIGEKMNHGGGAGFYTAMLSMELPTEHRIIFS